MTSSVTQCPECRTRFHVGAAQLEVHQGMVRCGRCHSVFNAMEYLHDNTPNPQLSLPIEEPTAAAVEELPVSERPDSTQQASKLPSASTATTLAQQVEFIEELTDEVTMTIRKNHHWPWLSGSAILLFILSAQIAYFFRVGIAAEFPAAKPLLMRYCEMLSCTVSLPKNAELMRIESSDIEADPQQANLITLHALLHNNSSYSQSYPELELTLLDMEEKLLARHVFHPAEYLKTTEEEKLGIAANRDSSIKLRLDTTDLKPTGYKLFLFYSQ